MPPLPRIGPSLPELPPSLNLIRPLGHGSFGQCYLVAKINNEDEIQHGQSNTPPPPSSSSSPLHPEMSDKRVFKLIYIDTTKGLSQVLREIKIMRQLSGHQRIVDLEDWFICCGSATNGNGSPGLGKWTRRPDTDALASNDVKMDEHHYVGLQTVYCEGGDLFERVAKQKGVGIPFEVDVVQRWMNQLAEGVAWLHQNGVLVC